MSDLITTRRALHGVAETVLAGPQYRRSGTIRLAITSGGFRTIAEPDLRVEGTDLVSGERVLPLDGTTCRRLAAAAGVDAGAPEDLYKDGSGIGLDDALGVDPDAAARLEASFTMGAEALRRLAPAAEPVLWPEHFDVGVTLDEVNYGISPGDGYLDEPYAYAGPWRPRNGSFWNAPFGATRPLRELPDPDAIHRFLAEARERASADPVRES
ncbi:hypothetical protein GCM10023085_47730 [Actinomadura viridis]|uniref:Uncharacterized protein n=1 Tax=Actinomadura viridis TaxID=58110 RepID=A0A931GL38_9ACTN|nr:hypothetical protein [Actinomadura viridis]MBG6090725.1 hypothetical protein [Actinomadura viridis]